MCDIECGDKIVNSKNEHAIALCEAAGYANYDNGNIRPECHNHGLKNKLLEPELYKAGVIRIEKMIPSENWRVVSKRKNWMHYEEIMRDKARKPNLTPQEIESEKLQGRADAAAWAAYMGYPQPKYDDNGNRIYP